MKKLIFKIYSEVYWSVAVNPQSKLDHVESVNDYRITKQITISLCRFIV